MSLPESIYYIIITFTIQVKSWETPNLHLVNFTIKVNLRSPSCTPCTMGGCSPEPPRHPRQVQHESALRPNTRHTFPTPSPNLQVRSTSVRPPRLAHELCAHLSSNMRTSNLINSLLPVSGSPCTKPPMGFSRSSSTSFPVILRKSQDLMDRGLLAFGEWCPLPQRPAKMDDGRVSTEALSSLVLTTRGNTFQGFVY